ncbi:MAG TPA: carbohydrate ABC transporter permease [Hypericibacter adhaerens]|jgi:ABC-type glycerol-3-phosphate transport system permease component|uniref:Binding-protein-dependent transport system inner membrane protein n=1 Tax=Hypericibacter adhaerens TaxID=2602016 RepID=A0A5J6N3V3_9PROT|nr:carbohydrate ABC transporter permease [Hypericibacter adhaerens]QEX24177.1 binding-protein-dependent transport system inner membrane protein [Hypericibacter adhaerens]HWA41941.1 carbohydrate ABC transporter permease [Hypericibacter adhaerens]
MRTNSQIAAWPATALKHATLIAFAGIALLPLYFMLVSAFKTREEFLGNTFGPPMAPVLSTLAQSFAGGDLFRWVVNSVAVTSASVLLSTALAALAAYPIALMKWRAGPYVLGALIALMVIPPIVLVIPLFQIAAGLRQLNTYQTVIVIYTGLLLPFSTFLLASFFKTISPSLIEAARMDGAGSWRIFRSILLPLSGPALATVVTVQALWVWNELLIAVVFLQSEHLRTLMVGLTVYNSRYRIDVPMVMAGMLWGTLPMLLLYLFGQRFFIRGLTAGGVKG